MLSSPTRGPALGPQLFCGLLPNRRTRRHCARRLLRRLSSRIGKAKAVTATARKIAVLFYNAVRHGMDYVDPGASSYGTRYFTRVIKN